MNATISFEIQGLKELQNSLNMSRINKEIAIGIGNATKLLTKTLETEIVSRYSISPSRFANALQGSSASVQTTGKNTIENSLEFKDIPLSLSRYLLPGEAGRFKGNIEPLPKKRKGWVHKVVIRRGQPKIVYGRYGQGGFTIKNKQVMVERTRPGRDAPLKVMYGPNIVDMVQWSFDHNTKVQQAFLNLSDVIFESIIL